MPDSLRPPAVEPLLRGSFGRPYLYADRCESTQRLLDRSLPEGAVAVCDEQTAGRGRLGRVWHAPPGTALLCSVLLRPRRGRRPAELSLVAGVATAAAVEEATSLPAALKWPNDVLVGGRKVAGVLAEAEPAAIVLGIGVNVNQREDELPAGARVPPGSLFTATGAARERAPLLASLLVVLERAYARWREGGLPALAAELETRDALRGRRVVAGGEPGIAAGIDAEGRLVVEAAGGRRLVESGEVVVAV